MDNNDLENKTFSASLQRSREIEQDIAKNPSN